MLPILSDFFVLLVFETVIDKNQLLGFKRFASLEPEHYCSVSDFTDLISGPDNTGIHRAMQCKFFCSSKLVLIRNGLPSSRLT